MRLAILGRTRILLNSIDVLKKAGHEIVLIGTCKESPESSSNANDFQIEAEKCGAVFFNNPRIDSPEILKLLYSAKAELAISLNWLTLIGEEAIRAFPLGILNAHAGDLPKYRGNATPNWAILVGEKELPITIHYIEPDELDSGPILLNRYFSITNETTIGELYRAFEKNVPSMFLEVVEGLRNGQLLAKPQSNDRNDILRCYPRIPSDSFIDWNKSAESLARIVRASSEPFCGAYTYLNTKKLIIWSAKVEELPYPSMYVPGQVIWRRQKTGEVGVATGEGVLAIKEVQIEQKHKELATSCIRSTRTRLGMMIEDEIHLILKRLELLENLK